MAISLVRLTDLRLGKRPFSKKQLDSWFQDDMASAEKSAKKNAKKYGVKWDDLNKREKAALTSQAFQLGETGQGNFENMWTALAAGDKETAALEALDSAWASQTPERAKDLYNALTPGLGFYAGEDQSMPTVDMILRCKMQQTSRIPWRICLVAGFLLRYRRLQEVHGTQATQHSWKTTYH